MRPPHLSVLRAIPVTTVVLLALVRVLLSLRKLKPALLCRAQGTVATKATAAETKHLGRRDFRSPRFSKFATSRLKLPAFVLGW